MRRRGRSSPWPAATTTRGPNPRIFPRAAQWEDSWDVSVNATWSLWDGGRNRAERAEAAATARAAEARCATSIGRSRSRSASAASKWTRAAPPSRPPPTASAPPTEAYRVVGERFRAGVATNTDVLDAESDLLQAQLDQTRALANARLADARLAVRSAAEVRVQDSDGQDPWHSG